MALEFVPLGQAEDAPTAKRKPRLEFIPVDPSRVPEGEAPGERANAPGPGIVDTIGKVLGNVFAAIKEGASGQITPDAVATGRRSSGRSVIPPVELVPAVTQEVTSTPGGAATSIIPRKTMAPPPAPLASAPGVPPLELNGVDSTTRPNVTLSPEALARAQAVDRTVSRANAPDMSATPDEVTRYQDDTIGRILRPFKVGGMGMAQGLRGASGMSAAILGDEETARDAIGKGSAIARRTQAIRGAPGSKNEMGAGAELVAGSGATLGALAAGPAGLAGITALSAGSRFAEPDRDPRMPLSLDDRARLATIYGAAEFIPERFALPAQLKAVMSAAGALPRSQVVPLLARAIAIDGGGEMTTQLATDLAEKLVGERPEITPEEMAQNMAKAGMAGVVQSLGLGGLGLGVGRVSDRVKYGSVGASQVQELRARIAERRAVRQQALADLAKEIEATPPAAPTAPTEPAMRVTDPGSGIGPVKVIPANDNVLGRTSQEIPYENRPIEQTAPTAEPRGAIEVPGQQAPVDPTDFSGRIAPMQLRQQLLQADEAERQARAREPQEEPQKPLRSSYEAAMARLDGEPATQAPARPQPVRTERMPQILGVFEDAGDFSVRPDYSPEQVVERAVQVKPLHDRFVTDIARSVGGGVILAPVKRAPRIREKITVSYNGDASQVKDAVRSTIVVNTPDDVASVMDALVNRAGLTPKRNLWAPGQPAMAGYRDGLAYLPVAGMPTEVQVNVPEFIKAKEHAHPYYERISAIQAAAKEGGRAVTAEERAEIAAHYQTMEAIFGIGERELRDRIQAGKGWSPEELDAVAQAFMDEGAKLSASAKEALGSFGKAASRVSRGTGVSPDGGQMPRPSGEGGSVSSRMDTRSRSSTTGIPSQSQSDPGKNVLPMGDMVRRPNESDKEFAKRVIDKGPVPDALPEDYEDYFDLRGRFVVVPLDKIDAAKSAEETKDSGINAARRMLAASRRQLSRRPPITVRMVGDRFRVVDGNSTLAAARQFGWESLPVQVEGRMPEILGVSDADRAGITSHQRDLTGGESRIGVPERGKRGSIERLGRKIFRKGKDLEAASPRNERRVVTAPDGKRLVIGKRTNADWLRDVESRATPEEVAQWRRWYAEVYPLIGEQFSKEMAPNVTLAWLLSQQAASPTKGMTDVLRVMDRLAGRPTIVDGKQLQGGLADNKIEMALKGESPDTGYDQKLLDFVDSAMGLTTRTVMGRDVRGGSPGVVDVWTARDVGFIDQRYLNRLREAGVDVSGLKNDVAGAPSETQYEWGSERLQEISDFLNRKRYLGGGWTPAQVQAVGWMNLQRALGSVGQSVDDVFDKNTRRVSAGLEPGEGSGGRSMAAGEVRTIANAILRQLGASHIRTSMDTAGAFLRAPEGSVQFDVFASPETIDDFMTMLGYATRQTMVIATRPMASGDQFYSDVVAASGIDTAEKAQAFYEAVLDEAEALKAAARTKPEQLLADRVLGTVAGFQQVVHDDGKAGVRFISIFGKMSPPMQDALQSVISRVADRMDVDVTIDNRNAEVRNVENDWSKEQGAGGRSYLDDLRARGRLQQVEWLLREYGADQGKGRKGGAAVRSAEDSIPGQVGSSSRVGAIDPSLLAAEDPGAPDWFEPGNAERIVGARGVYNVGNNPDVRAAIGGAISDMIKAGVPEGIIRSVDAWGTFSVGLMSAKAAMAPDDGKHVLMLSEEMVNSLSMSSGLTRTLRGRIAGYMVHELTHHIDVVSVDVVISAESPRMDYDYDDAKESYVMSGDLMQEVAKAMVSDKKIADFFTYPLGMIDGRRKSLIKSEVIAQMGSMYFADPKLMKAKMPLAYKVMESVYGAQESGSSQTPAESLEQARVALQAALQATGAGGGVQGRLFRGSQEPGRGVQDQRGAQEQPARPGMEQGARDRPGDAGRVANDDADAGRDRGVDSPAFKRWFGDSKVVDKDGNPLVVYHGTGADFDTFATDRLGAQTGARSTEIGHFFTDNVLVANQFARGENPNVMPVYLAIKNPLEIGFYKADDRRRGQDPFVSLREAIQKIAGRGSWEEVTSDDVSAWKAKVQAAGFDGVILRKTLMDGGGGATARTIADPYHDFYITFRPEQIKSATGNSGNYDPGNPSILAAQAPPPGTRRPTVTLPAAQPAAAPASAFTPVPPAAPPPTPWAFNPARQPFVYDQPGRWDNVVRTFQDKLVDTRRIQDAIESQFGNGSIREQMDVYLKDENYYGRVSDATKRAWDSSFEPLLEQMSKEGIPLKDLDAFLYARHAKERNAQMAKINPGPNNQGLSGMTDADANAIMAKARADGTFGKLMGLARRVDAITAATRRLIVTAGLEEAAAIKAWESAYTSYVPLFREEDEPSAGAGFSVAGPESRRAMGSTRSAGHILANVFAQHERIIQRAERAKVGRALYELAKHYPNDSFWRVDVAPKKKHIDPRTGFVVESVDPNYKQAENVVMVKISGVEHSIVFNRNNERALAMAHGLRNLDAARLKWGVQHLARVTRTMANLATQWNPVFWTTNFTRDYQTMLANVSSTPVANHRAKITKNIPSAMRGLYRSERGKSPTQWSQWADEFKREGGQTGYATMFDDIIDREQEIEREVKSLSRSPMNPLRMGRAFFRWISAVNNAIENSVRLAAYVEARQAGVSAGKAASVAKNLTVNFNRKGNAGAVINAFYMFTNANIQGNARMFQALTKSRVVQAAVGTSVMIGFLLDMLNRAMGDDDEDGNNQYDIIPEGVKQRNWIFMMADGKMFKIPMPYGYHVFPNLGRLLSEAMFDSRPQVSQADRAWSFVETMFDAFTPFGGAGSGLQMIAPTVADPFVQWAENKSWNKIPIRREQSKFGAEVPEYQLVQKKDTEFAKRAAKWLNDATGGDEVTPGWINKQPSFFDHIIRSLTLGTGATIAQTADLGIKVALDEEVSPNVVPFVNRFYGEVDDTVRSREFWSRYEKAKNLLDRVDKYRKQGYDEKADEIVTENRALIDLAQGYRASKKELSAINKDRKAVDASDDDYADRREAYREIEKRRTDILRRVMRESQ